MVCLFRVSGRNFDVDKFLKTSPWCDVADTYHRGDPIKLKLLHKRLRRKTSSDSGFQIEVTSNGPNGHINRQIPGVIQFLRKFRKEFQRLGKTKAVESRCLDFGVMWEESTAIKRHFVPAELLILSGELGIDIMISNYGWIDFSTHEKQGKKKFKK